MPRRRLGYRVAVVDPVPRNPNPMRFLSSINQPIHMLAIAGWTQLFGSFRQRERMGLIQPRPSYAYGMLKAADIARWSGKDQVLVIEFGVSAGAGFLAMVDVADKVTKETGVRFRIVGFDYGAGLPHFEGHKDHPELWVPGDFVMPEPEAMKARFAGRAELIIGDIKDTLDPFMETMSPEAPLGFVSVDVDLYSAAVSSLRVFEGDPELYNPAVPVYLDDISTYFGNRWCGELAAVHEFNDAHEERKIDIDDTLPGHRPYKHLNWYDRMFIGHILDHDLRTRTRTAQELRVLENYNYLTEHHLW